MEEEVKQDGNLEERKECEQGVRRRTKMTHESKKEGNIKGEGKRTKRRTEQKSRQTYGILM
jgi:hypothetical protein